MEVRRVDLAGVRFVFRFFDARFLDNGKKGGRVAAKVEHSILGRLSLDKMYVLNTLLLGIGNTSLLFLHISNAEKRSRPSVNSTLSPFTGFRQTQ